MAIKNETCFIEPMTREDMRTSSNSSLGGRVRAHLLGVLHRKAPLSVGAQSVGIACAVASRTTSCLLILLK